MTRKTVFRITWGLTVLLMFTLGCKMVDQVKDVVALVTDVGILATEVDIEGLVTEIDLESLATDIDLNSISTEMESMSTEMGSIVTEMGSFITDLPLFDGTPEPVNTPNGFPADIPLMEGEKSDMSGAPNRLEYTIDAEMAAAIDFYRREMGARGWVEQSADIQSEEAHMVFQNGSRRANVTITEDLFFGLTIAIDVQG